MKQNMKVRKSDDLKKPPGGFIPIASGKMGGYHKRKAGGGFEYWYPGVGVVDKPHDNDHADVHEAHEDSTPTPEVSAAVKKVRAKAEAAGLKLDGGYSPGGFAGMLQANNHNDLRQTNYK